MTLLFFFFLFPGFDDRMKRSYLNFYFLNLNSIAEKDYFLNTFKDPIIVNAIKNIQELFNQYSFHDPAILEHAKSKAEISLITKWQRQYYLDIYNEYHEKSLAENSRVIEIFIFLQSNKSFKFLIDLLDELDDSDEKGYKKTLKAAIAYSYLKMETPYKKENYIKNKGILEKHTEIINAGGSVLNMIDAEEKSHIEKSVDFFLSTIREKGEKG